jgi:hypothetical protein
MNDDCPNTERFADFMGHCRTQHEELNRLLRDIHKALHGNGREGMVDRVTRNSQRIQTVDIKVSELRADVDNRLDKLSASVGALNVRFWKMAIVLAVIMTTLNATVVPVIKSVLSVIGS